MYIYTYLYTISEQRDYGFEGEQQGTDIWESLQGKKGRVKCNYCIISKKKVLKQ